MSASGSRGTAHSGHPPAAGALGGNPQFVARPESRGIRGLVSIGTDHERELGLAGARRSGPLVRKNPCRLRLNPSTPRSVQERLEHLKSGVSSTAAAENGLLKIQGGADVRPAARGACAIPRPMPPNSISRIHALAADFKEQVAAAQRAMDARAARSPAGLSREPRVARPPDPGAQGPPDRPGAGQHHAQAPDAPASNWNRRPRSTGSFSSTCLPTRLVRRDVRKSVLASLRTFRPWLDPWFDGRRGKLPELEMTDHPGGHTRCFVRAAGARPRRCRGSGAVAAGQGVPVSALVAVDRGGGRHAPVVWTCAPVAPGWQAMLPSVAVAEGVLLALWLGALASSLATIRRAVVTLASARVLEAAAENQSAARLAELTAEDAQGKAEEGRHLSDTFREIGR